MFLYPIFSRRIAYKLEKEGYKVIQTAPNRNKPTLQVYYFEDKPALREAARRLISENHSN